MSDPSRPVGASPRVNAEPSRADLLYADLLYSDGELKSIAVLVSDRDEVGTYAKVEALLAENERLRAERVAECANSNDAIEKLTREGVRLRGQLSALRSSLAGIRDEMEKKWIQLLTWNRSWATEQAEIIEPWIAGIDAILKDHGENPAAHLEQEHS